MTPEDMPATAPPHLPASTAVPPPAEAVEPIRGTRTDPPPARPPESPGTVDESQGVLIQTGTVDEASGKYVGPVKRPGSPAVPGYEILGELGRGGMGVVYKANHLALDRVVALKMILGGAHVDELQLQRFRTEAQAVARLQHPGVVQVFEIGEHDGLPYFSLEYVAGGSLASKIKRQPQPPAEAARLAEAVARAVQAAHDVDVVHRDLKPANVLLTEDGSPKVTDFGLARRLEADSGQTQSGSVLGTPNYMPPEQARGEVDRVGPLADVYSLGAILYELLTGRPPFQGATIYETLEQVEKQEPVPPARLASRVPKDLDTICLKCLQKDSAKRYASAAALADDLRRFQEGRPIVARPTTAAERLWRLCKRNKVVSSLTASLAALLLLAAFGGPALAWAFKEQRDEAIDARREETKAKVAAVASEADAKEKEEAAVAAEKLEKTASDAALIAMRSNLQTTQDELKLRPDLDHIRQRLAVYAAKHLEPLSVGLRSRPLQDRTTAVAHQRLGDLYYDLGQYPKSREHFDDAHAVLAGWAKEHPDSPLGRRNLAGVKNRLGELAVQRGDGAAARAFVTSALLLRREWHGMLKAEVAGEREPPAVEERPRATPEQVHEARIAVAQSFALLGQVNVNAGDPRAALDCYRLARQNYDAVPAAYYANLEVPLKRRNYELERTNVEQRLGKASMQAGQLAEARKHLQEAFRQRLARRKQEIDKKEPEHIDVARDLAYSRCDMGDLELLYDGDPAAAVGWYRLAAAGTEGLAKRFPTVLYLTRDQAFADYRVGCACQRMARLARGVEAAGWSATAQFHLDRGRQALERFATTPGTSFQIQLMLLEARSGKRSAAASRADALAKQSPNDPRVLFHCACAYGLAGEFEKGMASLTAAVGRGWKDAEAVRIDPDLDPLRGQEGFAEVRRKVVADATKQ